MCSGNTDIRHNLRTPDPGDIKSWIKTVGIMIFWDQLPVNGVRQTLSPGIFIVFSRGSLNGSYTNTLTYSPRIFLDERNESLSYKIGIKRIKLL